ncbi:hypothetical protein [Streptomyces sp. NPDC046727]|uniref:hypothetical protein n=1 Tax=Streptomyces sp. NPDC046727 TaxID=3155373 RepID=UPI0033C2D0DC
MAVGSPQEQWLRSDLAAGTKPCTLAYRHQPRFTSGADHAPRHPSGRLDTTRGIRHFVAGMGGASHYSFGTIMPNGEARNGDQASGGSA